MKLDLQGIGLYPREVSTYCATKISDLMNALRGIYGLRRTCLAVSAILLSASTVHLLNLPSQTAAINLTQALHDLQTMSVNHRYAMCCIEIVKRLADQWGITLPESAQNITSFRSPAPESFNAPHMSVYFTQATLSNDSMDAFGGTSQTSRHDSGSIYEPSFVQHTYPVQLSTNGSAMVHQNAPSLIGTPHSMQSTPALASSSQNPQGLWQEFQPDHMVPTGMQAVEFQMMADPTAYGYNPYVPP